MYPLLLPLAWLYDVVTRLRNVLFDCGILQQQRFPLPVIAIGNLAVGGTGKTPHTEYLLRLLMGDDEKGVAVLSRGYGRRSKGFRLAGQGATASELGDEPLQMWQKFPAATVAVDADRRNGLARLFELSGDRRCRIVLLDDAYQHRYVRAGLYILLTDYSRRYSHDYVLPAGRLRESRRGARRAQIIVVTKCPSCLSDEERRDICRELHPRPEQTVLFTTFGYGRLYPLFRSPAGAATAVPESGHVLVVSGIARPEPLYEHLSRQGYQIHTLAFPDHHTFSLSDLARVESAFATLPSGSCIVTTEKDSVRLLPYEQQISDSLRQAFFVQPVEVRFCDPKEEYSFHQKIISYVTENQRDCRMD